jgi:serine/threonine protein phosphatase PrpC
MLTAADVTAAAEAALALAVRRGTADNVTVLVMALVWS